MAEITLWLNSALQNTRVVLQLMARLLGPLSWEEECPLGKPQGTPLVMVTGDQAANLAIPSLRLWRCYQPAIATWRPPGEKS